jgi:hypothetical protein
MRVCIKTERGALECGAELSASLQRLLSLKNIYFALLDQGSMGANELPFTPPLD